MMIAVYRIAARGRSRATSTRRWLSASAYAAVAKLFSTSRIWLPAGRRRQPQRGHDEVAERMIEVGGETVEHDVQRLVPQPSRHRLSAPVGSPAAPLDAVATSTPSIPRAVPIASRSISAHNAIASVRRSTTQPLLRAPDPGGEPADHEPGDRGDWPTGHDQGDQTAAPPAATRRRVQQRVDARVSPVAGRTTIGTGLSDVIGQPQSADNQQSAQRGEEAITANLRFRAAPGCSRGRPVRRADGPGSAHDGFGTARPSVSGR